MQAGQTDSTSTLTKTTKSNRATDKDNESALWDAVAYLTMLINEAYPAQFARAYPRDEDRERARGVWTAALKGYAPKRIKRAGQKAIRSGSKFMPSLGDIIQFCQFSYEELGLKQPLQAYYEACNATIQRADGSWSHPAVYFAAKATGWYWLRSESQSRVFPMFERNYQIICQRVQDGEDLSQDIQQGLEDFSKRNRMYQTEIVMQKSLKETMQQQGINPDAGRRAFQEVMKELK